MKRLKVNIQNMLNFFVFPFQFFSKSFFENFFSPNSLSLFQHLGSVDGGWSNWGSWTSCDFDTGTRKKERQCNNPSPLNGGALCAGNGQESTECEGISKFPSASQLTKTWRGRTVNFNICHIFYSTV